MTAIDLVVEEQKGRTRRASPMHRHSNVSRNLASWVAVRAVAAAVAAVVVAVLVPSPAYQAAVPLCFADA